MINYKYKCTKCYKNCHITIENDAEHPKACPYLFIIPDFKLICMYNQAEKIKIVLKEKIIKGK